MMENRTVIASCRHGSWRTAVVTRLDTRTALQCSAQGISLGAHLLGVAACTGPANGP
jgi:hypothetical protein